MNNNPIQFLMNVVSSGKDPNVIMQQVFNQMKQNPQMQGTLKEYEILIKQMQSSGMSPQQFVTQYAQQMGIDMKPFVNSVNNRGIRL